MNDQPAARIRSIPEFDTSFLPIFQRYREDNHAWVPDFSISSYLSLRGDYDLAAAFSKLFWPDFVEVDGCVLLAERYEAGNFRNWMESTNSNRLQVEAALNHTHVHDLFANSPPAAYPERLFDYLAQILSVCWGHALAECFPDKQFIFKRYNDPGPTISFHQPG